MANHLKNNPRSPYNARTMPHSEQLQVLPHAPSRIAGYGPISVIDIGSNSVRLVCYERLSRSPTPIFNEKALCGLGSGLAITGKLEEDAIEAAITAIHRFKGVSDQLAATQLIVLATAAARDASNGEEFIERVAEIADTEPLVLTGNDEALYSGYGILSGIYRADGVMGDMGGGSLEIADVCRNVIGEGKTFPLGGLRLQDLSKESQKKALSLAREDLKNNQILKAGKNRVFYAIGGTWRSLATLHMRQNKYPLSVLHHYEVSAKKMAKFCDQVVHAKLDELDEIDQVSKNRAPLIQYGAAVLLAVIEEMDPDKVVISALGIREGVIYEQLDDEVRAQDGLIEGARELSHLRSRSPENAVELIEWTCSLYRIIGWPLDGELFRWQQAACLLSDVGWRAHPDYRGEQSVNMIAHAAFVAIDHPARAFIALSAYFRHEGQLDDDELPSVAQLLDEEQLRRARLNGVLFRLAHLISASMPDTLLKSEFIMEDDTVIFRIGEDQAGHVGERLLKRLAQIEKIIGIKTKIRVADWV